MTLKDVLEALEYGSSVDKGKKALFSEGRQLRKLEEIKTSVFYQDKITQVLEAGEKYLNNPIKTLPFSKYRIFSETGSRKEFEKEYFQRRGRLNSFAVLSLVYGERKYIEALEDTIWAICDEYTWCLPAHLPNLGILSLENSNSNKANSGIIESKIRDYEKVIDLFSAETGFAFSEILSLLGDKLSPMVVYRARTEIKRRILQSYCDLNTMFQWETGVDNCANNWLAVCAGSVGAAAMYLIEEDSALAPIIYRLLATMETFLSGYGDDGICTEGLAYWHYGFGFFTYFAELLKQRTAGKIDLMDNKKVKEIALFQQKCFLSEDKLISFSDSSTSGRFPLGLTHHLKELFDEVEVPDKRFSTDFHSDHCYRWGHCIRNLIWSNPDYSEASLANKSYFLEEAQWFISKNNLKDSVICFAAKGGHNNEPHNHNDIGSFILHVNGKSLLTDLGPGEYTLKYFGPERYRVFGNGSESHSVPIIEGQVQGAGREYRADILEASIGEEQDTFTLDMTKAYNNSNLKKLVRNFSFEKKEQCRLILTDEFLFDKTPTSIIERFISYEKPDLAEEGKIRLQGSNNSQICILYNCKELEPEIKIHDFISHFAKHEQVYSINFKSLIQSRNVKLKVVFILN